MMAKTSVPDPHSETSAVVVVVVVVDGQDQTAVHGNAGARGAADQIRWAQRPIRHADIGDESADARTHHGALVDAKPAGGRAVGTNFTNPLAGDDSSGS